MLFYDQIVMTTVKGYARHTQRADPERESCVRRKGKIYVLYTYVLSMKYYEQVSKIGNVMASTA